MPEGYFFSLDGLDGAGKTTQSRLLADWLRHRGWSVTLCRDPGGTVLGERLREILLSHRPITLRGELLLFMASRAQLVAEVIRPALERGEIVLADRFLLASVVYQGHVGGLEPEEVWRLGRWATQNTLPHLTLVLDIPAEVVAQRKPTPADEFEQRGLEYLQRVRQAYLQEAARQPDKILVVSAQRSIAEVQTDLQRELQRVLPAYSRS